MELNVSMNTFKKGMDLDSDVSIIDKDSIRYAENIQIIANQDGTNFAIQNADYIEARRYPAHGLVIDFDTFKILRALPVKYLFKLNQSSEEKEVDAIFILTKENDLNDSNKILNRGIVLIDYDAGTVAKSIISGYFDWDDNIKMVYNRESKTQNKVYVVDGKNQLRVINLSVLYGNLLDNTSLIDAIPDATLLPINVINIINGNLKAGKVQYAYQLFNLRNNESVISPLCELIPISQTIGESTQNDVFGSTHNDFTGKGVSLKAEFAKGFEKFRLYRILYEVAGQIPIIQVADEFDIIRNQTSVVYDDFGSSYLNTITLDEFNALRNRYLFIPKTIESKNNRLFAANIKENTWDVDYDARAYRCDFSGEVVLKDTNSDDLAFSIMEIPDVPNDFDCINPSNISIFDEDSFKYVFNRDLKFGGTGINVSYEFTFVDVVLSSQDVSNNGYKPLNNFKLQVEKPELEEGQKYKVHYWDENNSLQKTVTLDKSIIPNYSDSWMCNNCVGYHRDEIYRFGIVFYNKKGIATPVHWIGDIRFPCEMALLNPIYGYEGGDNIRKTFFTYNETYIEYLEKYPELVGKAIGIKFDVKNVPSEAVSYEIVRCSRTEQNRTIVAQVAVSSLVKSYYTSDDKIYNWTYNGNDKTLYPQAWLNFAAKQRVAEHNLRFNYNSSTGNDGIGGGDNSLEIVKVELRDTQIYDTSDDVFELISPEICIDQVNAANIIKNNKLCCIGGLYSYYFNDKGIYRHRIATSAKRVYNMTGDLSAVGIREYFNGVNYDSSIQFVSTDKNVTNVLPHSENQGFSIVFKYYNTVENLTRYTTVGNSGGIEQQYIPNIINIKDVTIPNQLSEIIKFNELKDFQHIIGENSYINASVATKDVWGKHGVNLVVHTDKIMSDKSVDKWGYNWTGYTNQYLENWAMLNGCRICNIKKQSTLQSGTFSERSNSIYIGCNAFQTSDKNESVYCFGGDTYLGVLDYLNTQYTQQANDYDSYSECRIHTQCYIPFETSVNLNLLTNKQYHHTVQSDENIGQNLISVDPVVYAGYVQSKPLYQYNTVYSQQNNMFPFVTKSLYSEDNAHFSNRIIASEIKVGQEITDPWLIFKVANYLHVENVYGEITNLKTFDDKLIFFQDNAVGTAAVNERSLVTDNNIATLTLGTGNVLERFDYLSNFNGSVIINDKSIVDSDHALYWYDYNKNAICSLTNTIQELSKLKKVQSYLTSIYDEDIRSHVQGIYDKKHNQIWFKFDDKSLIFNEYLNVFTSFNTTVYDEAITDVDGDIKFIENDQQIYVKTQTYDKSNNTQLNSKFTIVVNDNFMYPKVFDNIMFYADFNGNINNITDLWFETKNQISSVISAKDIECREDTYRCAIPREKETKDQNNLSYLGRMRGNYLEETFVFDCNNNQTFKIPYIKTTYRQSKI